MNDVGARTLGMFSAALIAAGVLLAFAMVPRSLSPFGNNVGAGRDAPDFELATVANAPRGAAALSLRDLRGRTVVLDFWATWCGPCRAEAPVLDRLSRRWSEREGPVVVGVNTSDEPGAAEGWARDHALSFPIVFDARNAVARDYGVENLPTLVIVSPAGRISAVRTGLTQESELIRLVARASEEKTASP